ncbi:MAG: IS66 family transposase [Nitrosopumilaceae archaeon]|nr:IS66 family transposase [Nitrosopumilaceae archaeon]NIU87452.1 IS66 family transposase [Nitrosopumilaceae archaeon]NIV65962.1 IS66 family transposase [Nitrosopumilaceae archaeon]NIX61619.1 IS66 family transposase [Nitrosopumilaceae archaeon]
MANKPTINKLYKTVARLEAEVKSLKAENKALRAENKALKKELARYETPKTSRNSSIPPSKDENRPIKNKSLRGKAGRKVGGQKGHKGFTLNMTDKPDKIEEHTPFYCEKCGNDITDSKCEYMGRRQVVDIPPVKPEITEHRVFKRRCTCGHETISGYPENVNTPVSYGSNVESLIGYFHSRQYIPFARMQEIFHDIFGLPISEGGIHYLLDRLALKATPAYEMIRQTVFKSKSLGSDETGAKVNGKKHWFWTWQSKRATLITVSSNRGFDTIQENCGDKAVNAILVHDCWKPHFQTLAKGHQLCTAHLLRELNYLEEKDKIKWPTELKDILTKALKLKKKLGPGDYYGHNKERKRLEASLSKLLGQIIDEKYKDTISFQKRLVKYRDHIFTFLYHPKVPPDNNDSEKAIRNVKVKQKISGQFKSTKGADVFAILRSVTDTAIKNEQNILDALKIIANLKIQTD